MKTKIRECFGLLVFVLTMLSLTSCEVEIDSWYERTRSLSYQFFCGKRDRLHRICQEISVGLMNSFLPEVWYSLVLGTGKLHRRETPI